jgi:glycosyltransferase involved in cell wall biosynthesis
MNKIGIIELASHYEVARAYVFMFLRNGYSIDLFTTESNFKHLNAVFENEKNLTCYLQKESSAQIFLNNNKQIIDKCNFVICCTGESADGAVLHKTWDSKSYIVIHDVNNYFDYKNNINFSGGIKQYLRIFKYFMTSYFSKRIKAMESFDAIIVPSPCMADHMKDLKVSKSVKVLPFAYNEFISSKSHKNEINIVIPGTVSQRSRDYFFIFQVLNRILKGQFDQKINLTFLGLVRSKEGFEIVNKFQSLKSEKFAFTTFEGMIPQDIFDEVMKNADALILPLQSSWQYGIVNEKGSISCLSGNIGDMVRYGIPALLPNNYMLQKELLPMVVYYEPDVEIASEKIKTYVEEKSFNKGKDDMEETVKNYHQWIEAQIEKL